MNTPSKYQVRILEYVTGGEGSAVVKAVAGSGKTTTLILCLEQMQGKVIFLAFNKKIAYEIDGKVKKKKLNNVKVSTMHAAGFAQLRRVRGARYNVVERQSGNKGKLDLIIDDLIHQDVADQIKYVSSFIYRLVSLAKDSAFGVKGQASIDDLEAWDALATHHDIQLEETELSREEVLELCIKVLNISNADRFNIDCADMIYHVLLFDMDCEKYDWVLVDEAQDTNVSRRLLAAKLLAENGRLIAVGDDAQAIFGFTGADAHALNLIKEKFNAIELPLSICYRCAKSIVREAQKIVPTIEWAENAPEGEVTSTTYEKFVKGIADLNLNYEDGIICRNNAPLVPLAFALIRKGIACKIEGKDIGARLAKYTQKWKDRGLLAFQVKFNEFMTEEIEKALSKKNNSKVITLEDDRDTINAVTDRCIEIGKESVVDLKHMILDMFSDSETGKIRKDILTLSSIHKSKGLEWRNVYVLGFNQFMPSPYATMDWMREQEDNLKYVAITRAMEKLVYVEEVPKASQRRNGDDSATVGYMDLTDDSIEKDRYVDISYGEMDAEEEIRRMEGGQM